MFNTLKRLLVGRPLATSEQEHQRISKVVALAVFSSDAISSTAYATEQILFVIAVGGSSLALGLSKLVPIAIAVAILLVLVTTSYRQTIFAYPSGGGSYIVSRENLGENPALVAGASLMVDYILTVAVSVSAGVAAIISIPQFQGLEKHRVAVCLGIVLLITLANLRGIKESGRLFAFPTYAYIFILTALVFLGLTRTYFHWFGGIHPIPFDKHQALPNLKEFGGSLSLFILLRGFSSGAVALTGVEAISNGVPAFRRPESKNAATTLTWMATILGTLFLGVSILAHHLHPYPSDKVTVFSEMGKQVFGNNFVFWFLQLATAAILTLAANTAYADFPRLSSIIARDGYLPRQLANRGDRLVFSNGVIVLAGMAERADLRVRRQDRRADPALRGRRVHRVHVVAGRHGEAPPTDPRAALEARRRDQRHRLGRDRARHDHLRGHEVRRGRVDPDHRDPGDRGAVQGDPPPLLERRRGSEGAVGLQAAPHEPHGRRVGRQRAPRRARSARLREVALAEPAARGHRRVRRGGAGDASSRRGASATSTCRSRSCTRPTASSRGPILRFIDELDARYENSIVTVVLPEFVVGSWWSQLLHNQSALFLKGRLLFRKGTVVTSVPYHLED